MVGAGCVVDELDAVVGGIGLEAGLGGPGVGAAVLGAFDDGVEGNDVFRGTTEEDERYGAGCGWLKVVSIAVLGGMEGGVVLTFQVMVYGCPTGTISLRLGLLMGFPLGLAPTGVV